MATIGSSVMAFFVKFFTAETALRLTFAAMVVSAFGVLQLSLLAISTGIEFAMPQGLVDALAFALPSNTGACVAAALAADAAVTGFRVFVTGLAVKT